MLLNCFHGSSHYDYFHLRKEEDENRIKENDDHEVLKNMCSCTCVLVSSYSKLGEIVV